MTPWQLVTTTWNWDPSVLLGSAVLIIGYTWATRFRISQRTLTFGLGILILLFALESPLDMLGDTYLFSAHMFQHLLLILIVPPLLIAGLPPPFARKIVNTKPWSDIDWTLTRPLRAWLLGIGTLWLWHVPPLYNAALTSEMIHVFQHLSFLVTATIFWWPIMGAPPERRLTPPIALIYLMAAGMASTFLGILLAYWPQDLYPRYQNPTDLLGILPLIRNTWGVSARLDREIGGLMMWVPGSFVYIRVLFGIFFRWLEAATDDPAKPA